jgi:putative selenium metabolism hydrolase
MRELSSSEIQGLNRLAQDLVRTPSLPGDEGAVAALLAEAMQQSGFDQVWVDRIGNVVGRFGRGRGPALLFDGHMDTVDVGDRGAWTHGPFDGDIVNGVLFGRGAIDMKSSLAAMIYGVKLLARSGARLAGDLYVAFVVQEEPCEGAAVQHLIETEGIQPDFVVLGEPTNLGVYLGHRGRVELQVSIQGRAGHAAIPQGGVNAIAHAARLVFNIDLLAPQLLSDPILGQGTVAVTHIASSAGSLNSIPDACTLVVDRRLTLGETEARAIAEIQQLVRREQLQASIATLNYEITTYTGQVITGRKYYPPWLLPENTVLARRAARAIERVLGVPPRFGAWPFSTDGAYTLGAAGIPTVGFGPGDERRAHAPDEQVRLADVALAAQGYAQLAAEILK